MAKLWHGICSIPRIARAHRYERSTWENFRFPPRERLRLRRPYEEGTINGKSPAETLSVVLLDEIEKTHPDVFNILLQCA